jgi:hypothetical protein
MKKCRVLDAARKRAWRPEPAREPLPPQNAYEPPRAALGLVRAAANVPTMYTDGQTLKLLK